MSTIQPSASVVHPMGWYPDVTRPGFMRYWNGEQWLDEWRQVTPFAEAHVPVAVGNLAPVQQVVVNVPRKRVNHVLHLLLSIITVGLWIPVWIVVSMAKA